MIALYVLAAIAALLLIAVIRTLLIGTKKSEYAPDPDPERAMQYAKTLSRMVAYDTTSHDNTPDIERFRGFHNVLREQFPNVFQKLEVNDIDGNLLIYWRGEKHDEPVLLLSHMDVVPAEGQWEHGPFSGDIENGKVWGRGSVDTKCSLMAFMQAAEELLRDNYVPQQDIYLASSCTEEWGGDGAPKIVAELKRRSVKLFMVCDEGGGIISDPIGGVHGSYAMVGVFEKGKANVKFTAKSVGGHASAPGKNTPVDRIAAFVNDVKTHDPFKKKISPEVRAMFSRLAPYAPFGLKLVFGNLWLFGGLLKCVMPSISAQAGAMLKTTIAFTTLSGSHAYNVIPSEAALGANMRFIPHQGEKESLDIVRRRAEKHGLEMEVLLSNDYSKPIDIHGKAFSRVEEIISETFPGLPCSPYVVTGATDCCFFQEICDNCVRFSPIVFGPEQLKSMHGVNEYLEYNALPAAVDYYKGIIKKAI